MADLFPSIQTLMLPMFYDSIPYLKAPVPSLHTVVIDGSGLWSQLFGLHQILVFLQNTPSLQVFWFKELDQSSQINVNASSFGPTDVDPTVVQLPITLPNLKCLAVSVPGTGGNLLHVINVPILEDLHMDGSRYEQDGWSIEWLYTYLGLMAESLAKIAPRAPALRRIAMTEAYLSRGTWEWLLGCCDDRETETPPFPRLESIAVRGLKETNGEVVNTLDDELIQSYASSTNRSRIHFVRFSALQSELDFRGETILKMADSVAHQPFELEIDSECEGITQAHIETLISRNVRVIYHGSSEDVEAVQKGPWWSRGADIDPLDKDAY